MDHYIEIAHQYFLEVEGWYLYPSYREWKLWGPVILAILMLVGVAIGFAIYGNTPIDPVEWLIVVSIAATPLFFALHRVYNYRKSKFVQVVNKKHEQQFNKTDECCVYLLKQKLKMQERVFIYSKRNTRPAQSG